MRSQGYTNAANSTFFGSGGLSGTIKNTNIDYTPIAETLLNPGDFPDLSGAQLSALQGQINAQTDALNLNRQKLLNQFNEARQTRLNQNEDALATTQQLFSVVGGINPLQSGRNAAALTGMQAGVRNDLVNMFNKAQEGLLSLDVAAQDLNAKGLQGAIDANLKMDELNFNRGLQLTDRVGSFVDENGNPYTVAGQTSTLQGEAADRAQQQALLQQQQAYSSLYGYVTGPNGEPMYRKSDGTPTSNLNDPNIQRTYRTTKKDANGNTIFTTNPSDPNRDPNDVGTPSLYRNEDMLAKQLQVQQAMLGSLNANVIVKSQYGANATVDSKGNVVIDAYSFNRTGINLSDVQKYNAATGTTGMTDTINKMIGDNNLGSQPFNKMFFDQTSSTPYNTYKKRDGTYTSDPNDKDAIINFQGPLTAEQQKDKVVVVNGGVKSGVFFRANTNGAPSGYYGFQIVDPSVKVPQNLPNAKPNELLSDYLRNNVITDQQVASTLSALAKSNPTQVKEIKKAEDILNAINGANGDDPDKQVMLRAMAAQQVNSDFALEENQRAVRQYGDELSNFIAGDLQSEVLKVKDQYSKRDSKIVEEVKNKGVFQLALERAGGGKYNFNNSGLSKDDMAKAQTLKSILNYGSELRKNYGSGREEDAKQFFRATVAGTLGSVSNPNYKLADNLFMIDSKLEVRAGQEASGSVPIIGGLFSLWGSMTASNSSKASPAPVFTT